VAAVTTVEICVEDAVGVRRARDGGADRIEICTDLSCGGLTPAFDEVAAALEVAPAGGVQVLVRPRPGDFVHSREEVDRIASDIVTLSSIGRGAPVRLGFVVGVITRDGQIDVNAAARLRDTAEDAPLTFHRGFDQVVDRDRGLDVLMELGYDRVLTTGGDPAVAQPDALARLVERGGDDIIILVSGGLRAHNVAEVVAASGAREVHMRAPGTSGTDQAEVERIVAALHG
jgi:copper homeostasis protein cutC